MKFKSKKCPKCGFKAKMPQKIVNTGKKKRKIKITGKTKRIITSFKLIRSLGSNEAIYRSEEEYKAMKICPYCKVLLGGASEKK